jgi:methylated-DNA-protein-cysteine methyltransferase-like protein
MSPFKDSVISIIRMIPQGKVASYGQIAAYVGLPRAAREVGWILRGSKEDMPWWRVLNNAGKISIEGNMTADKVLQRKLLENDGVEVLEDFTLNMELYRWRLDAEVIKQLQLDDEYIQQLLVKYR